MRARHELKHSLNYIDYLTLRSRVQAVLKQDGNVDDNGEYRVRSLYFDTPGDRALRQKIDGVNQREKFRIRLYNGSADYIVLEKKSKSNGLCYKQSVRISAEQAQAIVNGQIDWMLQDGRPLLIELYSKMRGQLLRPKTIVDYVREPFTFPAGNVRITFDRDLRTGLQSTDLLSGNLLTVCAGNEIVLLEVKYDAFLPQFIQDLLQIGNRRAAACSKYALCRTYG